MAVFHPLIDIQLDRGTADKQVVQWNDTTKRYEATLTPSGLTSIGVTGTGTFGTVDTDLLQIDSGGTTHRIEWANDQTFPGTMEYNSDFASLTISGDVELGNALGVNIAPDGTGFIAAERSGDAGGDWAGLYIEDLSMSSAHVGSYHNIWSRSSRVGAATDVSDAYDGINIQCLASNAAGQFDDSHLFKGEYRANGSALIYPNLYGGLFFANLDDVTITNNYYGVMSKIDMEAAATISGDAYVFYADADMDGTVTGNTYMLYLNENTGVDYGIYQNGTASNVLGGDLTISSAADALLTLESSANQGRCYEIMSTGNNLDILGGNPAGSGLIRFGENSGGIPDAVTIDLGTGVTSINTTEQDGLVITRATGDVALRLTTTGVSDFRFKVKTGKWIVRDMIAASDRLELSGAGNFSCLDGTFRGTTYEGLGSPNQRLVNSASQWDIYANNVLLAIFDGTSPPAIGFFGDLYMDNNDIFGVGELEATTICLDETIKQNLTTQTLSGTKTLVDGTATGFVDIAIGTGEMIGGEIMYTMYIDDGTDLQAHTGGAGFVAVNKAGTVTSDCQETYLNPSSIKVVTAGTLTDTLDCVDGAGKITLRFNANTSLNVSIKLDYIIRMHSMNEITKL